MRRLALALPLALAACGGDDAATPDAQATAPFGEPVEIAALDGSFVDDVVADAQRVFWGEDTGTAHEVTQWELTGDAFVIGTQGGDGPFTLAVLRGEIVYTFDDLGGCTVGAFPIDGGQARVLEAALDQSDTCTGLSTDGTALAWGRWVGSGGGEHVSRADSATAAPVELWSGALVWDTAVAGDDTFWSAGEAIWRSDGTTAELVIEVDTYVKAVAVDGDRLYWGNDARILSVPLDDLAATPTEHAEAGGDVTRLGFDDAYVYALADGRVEAFPRDGGAAVALTTGDDPAHAFAVGHGGVFQVFNTSTDARIEFTPRND